MASIFALIEILETVVVGIIAGLIGSLTGLGGGTVLTPILTLFLGVPISYAAGASLISTIATSSGAGSVYIKDKITNVRIGMSLEIGTTIGSVSGVLTAHYVYSWGLTWIIFIIFGLTLLMSLISTARRGRIELPEKKPPDRTTRIFRLQGKYYDAALKREVSYHGVRWWLAEIIMFFSGFISGMLGIGGGALKVLGLDWAMNLPMKVSTATSNFMIGVTAATGSSLYWRLGYIHPLLASATAIGVLLGAMTGTKFLSKMSNKQIRWIFTAVLGYLAVNMILRGIDLSVYMSVPKIYQYMISFIAALSIITLLYYFYGGTERK